MNILQIKPLSVNSISVDYSLCVKVGQNFFNLFIVGNRVIVCSEPSFVRSDVYFFVQDTTIIFQWSIAALFQYTSVGTFTTNFKFSSSMSYYIDKTSLYI